MVTTRHPNTERAMGIIEEERACLERERAAFRRFVRRLDRIEPVRQRPTDHVSADGGSVVVRGGQDTADRSLRAVTDAYRETVMAVEHYDREYGEPLAEHVAAEFGESVARELADGTVLTPVLYRSLQAGASRALEDRADLSALLEREADCLRDCRESMAGIETTLYRIVSPSGEPTDRTDEATADRLLELERECESVLERRQRYVRNQAIPALQGDDEIDLQEYLYDGLDVVYPVLSDLADCVETIRDARRQSRPACQAARDPCSRCR